MRTCRLRAASSLQQRVVVCVICLLASPLVVADQNEPDTAVTGTEGNDNITVTSPESADASIISIVGETSTATATVVDSLGGSDTVNVDTDIDANSDVNAGILLDPDGSESTATSIGINAGDGADLVTNSGLNTTTATSRAAYAAVLSVDISSIEVGSDEIDVSVNSAANSTGIDTGAGDDVVVSSSAIGSMSRSTTGGVAVGVPDAGVDGDVSESVTTKAESIANSTASGVNLGEGDDEVTNSGSIVADAGSTSGVIAVNVAASDSSDPDKKIQSNLEASAIAEATANGIDTDGESTTSDSDLSTTLVDGGLQIDRLSTETAVSDNDRVTNTNSIDSISSATSDSTTVSASIGASGSVKATLNAAATANSSGILTGGGDDVIVNGGGVVADSTAFAYAVGTSVTSGQGGDTGAISKQKTDSSTTVNATANSVGIDAEGSAQSTEFTSSTTMGATGIANTRTTKSIASTGADKVRNTSTIDASSMATSGARLTTIQVEADGAASSQADSTAKSRSAGISAGAGNDIVDNLGVITTDATSIGGALSVTFAQGGTESESKANAKVSSEADAAGIAADGNAIDTETTTSLSIGDDGLSFERIHTETAQHGDDDVTNSVRISATATATSGAAGAAVAIDGAASTDITSTSTTHAAAIDAGGGSDLVDNSGEPIEAMATSTAGALAVGFAQKTAEKAKPKVEVKASASAEASATGIAGDSGKDETSTFNLDISATGLTSTFNRTVIAQSGNDVIDSNGTIIAGANAASVTAGVSVAIDGAAKADIKASAGSNATGISAGGGNDAVSSGGIITVGANSNAAGIAVGVGVKSSDKSKAKTKVSAETEAKAKATGITTDGGLDDSSLDVSLAIDSAGVRVGYARTTTAASGDDTLNNSAVVTSTATADTAAASAAVTIDGGASADLESTAEARARGLDSGGGIDTIDNIGELTTSATATALTVEASVSTKGGAKTVGLLDGGTSATSDAAGISSAGSDHSTSTTITTDINFDDFSVVGSYEKIEDHVSGDGADVINNSGTVTTTSEATTAALSVAVSGKGTALTLGRASADAHSGGIESGNDDDIIHNDGVLISSADSTAVGANVAVTAKGVGVAGNAAWDGGTTATSTATGIDADSGKIKTTRVDAEASLDRAQVVYETTEEAASGNDVITNTGVITVDATSEAKTLTVAVSPKGVAAAVSTSTAESTATGIRGGDGDDDIDNSNTVTTTAKADAKTANVSVTGSGASVAADAVWDSGTKAEATSIGIAGDGGDQMSVTRIAVGTDEMSFGKTSEIASGADTIRNSGNVTANADANALSISAAVTASTGVAAATATSTAIANASAIDAGAGSEIDDVYNSGILNATAEADAASASVSFTSTGASVAADSVWDGGTTATARARGIDVGSGGETILNDGEVNSTADSLAGSVAVAVTLTGVAGATATATGTANSTAIDASASDDADIVTNTGDLTSTADADAAALSVSVTNAGLSIAAGAVWEGGTGADAISRGIDVGDGADQIINSGVVTVVADSDAKEAAVSVAVSGVAGAVATSTATADAIGLDAGDDIAVDDVDNSGDLVVTADADALTSTVSVTTVGVAVAVDSVWDGGTTADASAKGIHTGQGGDTISNDGYIDVEADATTASLAVGVAITGAAGASASANGNAAAAAIDAGAGAYDDSVINTGQLDADAISLAVAASATFTSVGVSAGVDAFEGGTTSNTVARGIQMGSGADSVENHGVINSIADSTAASAAVAVALSGVAGAVATSTSTSDASAIDTSQGDDIDTVFNDAIVSASAKSLAATATVSVTLAGGAVAAGTVWDGGTTAEANARGIEVGAGADVVENEGEVISSADAEAAEVAVSVAVTGVAGAISTSTAIANSTAIAAGEDDSEDTIMNSGGVTANSEATAVSAAVSFAAVGVSGSAGAAWEGGTTAESSSTAMTLGGGTDTVRSDGVITADSESHATGISVAVTIEGVAGGISAATAFADATGIDAGAGDDVVDTAGSIIAGSLANGNSVSVAAVKFGVSAAGGKSWDGGTRGEATASGITAGTGMDTIDNSADIESIATATAVSTAVSFTLGGVSAASTSSSADAEANAIDSGADNDRIDNFGDLSATADANAVAVSVALTGIGVGGAGAVWDGGTTTDATARGIAAGDGDDVIETGVLAAPAASTIMSTAESTAVSVTTAVTVGGFGGAVSTSTANADSTGIDAGAGDDKVLNNSDVQGIATATSDSVNVSVTGVGGAVAADSFWNGGTKANANASGIAGGDGIDELRNTHIVTADSHSEAISVAVAATAGGIAIAKAASTSTADAAGMRGDAGADSIFNEGTVNTSSLAEASGVSVAACVVCVAVAGSFMDNGTTANATASGLVGGAGTDNLINTFGAVVDTNATAATTDTSVSLSLQGISAAGSKATATANAVALDGGSADDNVSNEGTILQNAIADSTALSLAIVGGGGAISSAGSLGHAMSTGLAGGDGNDAVDNSGEMTLTATANADGQSLSIAATGGGASIAEANADAIADASGLRGDAGADLLSNSGTLNVDTEANTTARAISLTLGPGVSLGKANSVSTAGVTAMTGGAEDDELLNSESGVIEVSATADAFSGSFGITVGGIADAEARSITNSMAVGLSGDAGEDEIRNEGHLGVQAKSINEANGTTIGFFGVASAKAGTEVETVATGIAGGEGADMIVNTGTIRVGPAAGTSPADRWMSVLKTTSSSFGFAGGVSAESAAYAKTSSTGIDGGNADDQISNDGIITVFASALSDASASSLGIFGSSDSTGGSGAFTFATGLAGGAGNDVIESLVSLDVTAESRLQQDSTSFEFGGSSDAGAALEAATDAVGISGGTGLDQIRTDGLVNVSATSSLSSDGGGTTIFGGSDVSAQSRGVTRAAGVDAGDDDDVIENLSAGAIDVSASTKVDADSVAYTLGGSTGSDNLLTGESFADGLLGGGGNDEITNDGYLKVSADVVLTATGGSKATFTGGSAVDATGKSVAFSRAVGIDGGAGDDTVVARGTTIVDATTSAEARNKASSTASFTSEGVAASISEATADAIGLDGGDGINMLMNEGDLFVTATSTGYAFSYSSGASVSFSGDAESRANSTAVAIATGITATGSDNVVTNGGTIDVTATSGTAKDLTTTLTVYRLQGNNDEDTAPEPEDAIAETVTELPDLEDPANQTKYDPRDGVLDIVYCKSDACVVDSAVDSAGNHYVSAVEAVDDDGDPDTPPVDVYSWVVVGAVDGQPDLSDPAVRSTYPEGTIVACTADSCQGDPAVNSSATYYQVVVTTAGDPPVDEYGWVAIDGLVIEVAIDVEVASFPTYAAANGNGLDGDGFATATGRSEAHAYGMKLDAGNDTVISNDMNVQAVANTVINVASDGDVFGDSTGYVNEATALAKAVGIDLGDGANSVINTGTMNVLAAPSAQAVSEVSAGGGVCIWFFGWWCGGEGTPDARASASFIAEATGIRGGSGSDLITNDNTINVTARPDVAVDSRRSDEFAVRTGGDSGAIRNTGAWSTAIGVQTGGGDDQVTNNGNIVVAAYDLRSGCGSADGCGIPGSAQKLLVAIGVQTGDGEDVVINNGLVSALTYVNNVPAAGIGIDTGAGNDQLTLGAVSEVIGSVSLGTGDDTLTLIGSPLVHDGLFNPYDLFGGGDNDTLVLAGPGGYFGVPRDFENAVKTGDGIYSLPALATLDSLTIEGGILALNSGYTFAASGSFSTYIHSGGDRGQLLVDGSVISDGAITVDKRGDTYIADGTRYTVVDATAVSNGFVDITLPESRPLLSFELQQTANTVDIVAVAGSFSTVASSPSHIAVAENLFGLRVGVSGDFSVQLGTLQDMESGFDRAFASLSPDSYKALTSNTIATGHQTTQLLRTHLGNARAVRRGSRMAYAAYEPVLLAYAGGEMNTNGAAAQPFLMAQAGPVRDDDPALSATASAPGSGSSRQMAQTWASAFFADGDYDLVDGFTKYQHDSGGFAVGADYLFGNNLIAGFTVSYADTELDLVQAVAEADIEAWSGGLYATGYWDNAYVEGGVTFSRQSFSNIRTLMIGSEERMATSEHDGETWMAFVGAGREFDRGTWQMEPYASLYYFDISEDRFEETGADSLNLIFAKKSTSALLGEIGTTFVRLQDVDSGVIDWHASLAYNYDFDIDDGRIAYAYDGAPGSVLMIDDRNITAGSAVFGAGLAYIRKRSILSFDYRGQFNSDYRNDILGLRLAYSF